MDQDDLPVVTSGTSRDSGSRLCAESSWDRVALTKGHTMMVVFMYRHERLGSKSRLTRSPENVEVDGKPCSPSTEHQAYE